MNERTKQIEEILRQVREEGFQNGLAEGYRAAERIAILWGVNHKLKVPHSVEWLIDESRKELENLKIKLT
jgi:flagellar biosynthesis/type III secretory pathway protein FliH